MNRNNVIWDFEEGWTAQEIARYWRYDSEQVLELLRAETGIPELELHDSLGSLQREEEEEARVKIQDRASELEIDNVPLDQRRWNLYDRMFGRR